MSGDSDLLVVTTLVYFVFYRTRGCGCIERPAFPAPSMERAERNEHLAQKACGEIAKLRPPLFEIRIRRVGKGASRAVPTMRAVPTKSKCKMVGLLCLAHPMLSLRGAKRRSNPSLGFRRDGLLRLRSQ